MADVTRAADGSSWTYECPGVPGDPCGPWSSAGWPTRKVAEARGEQHARAHTHLEVTPSLEDFRADQGLVAHDDGVRAVKA